METYSAYNVAVVLFAAFGSLFAGYGLAVIVSTLGQPTFYSSLNLAVTGSHTTAIIGAANGVFFAGGFFGCLISAWAVEGLGRLNGLRLAAVIGVIGSAIQTGAVNQGMYLAARVITGVSVGQVFTAMPTYFSEVSPPHSRGLMAGAHGSFVNAGYALAAWVGFACFHASGSSFGWRFPNAVLLIFALCVLAGTFFIPESPRWLCARGRDQEALQILCRLHHDKADPEDHFAHRELGLIKKQLDADKAAVLADGKWQLFTKETYRKRMILALMLMIGGQNVGVLVINNYNTLLYQSLGLSTSEALIVGAAYNTWAMIGNFVGAMVSDRLGRRKALLGGYIANVAMFTIATALIAKYSETTSKSYAAAALTFLFLYVTAYGGAIDPNQYTVCAEIFPSHLRSMGTGLAVSGLFLADTLWLQLASTAMATIGWKYYLVFLCLGVVHTIFLYFKLPETSGLALEEIDALFGKAAAGHIQDEELEKVAATHYDTKVQGSEGETSEVQA
ncbi:hypothetical protein LTR10_014711 [Elasticomyces elasticus]|uniref:Major facilitator superfamily (MFS) profile domain-containing protein n=1 Tax=Exophiala sideris TaxID=1016849 RepID=A0ABR0J7B3_9EURO|nr:hypothetical protein LTR10_014711 [Elasticomyces elasticus]KAK5029356.1 hypothetical protein LTS07_005818 [Exophiala sideris]KAK5036948.1 hypothetical protein LTR13_005328 [Exophiala sideris]KAK5057986.1 hypothetical protein LTR69_006983 [Exophiala sideris]KAK5181945.1 hypothetical protein LTR44_005546 [Eurotiomycetes sp. CCFEE 6388]